MPLVSAADWLNSQSADRLNIRSADWPAARSSGDITQADQPTLQKPSAPSPLIRDTTHTTYSHTNNHIIQHTRTINNEVASNTDTKIVILSAVVQKLWSKTSFCIMVVNVTHSHTSHIQIAQDICFI